MISFGTEVSSKNGSAYFGMAGSEADLLVVSEGGDHQAMQLPPLLQQWAQFEQILPAVFQQALLLLCTQMQCLLQESVC